MIQQEDIKTSVTHLQGQSCQRFERSLFFLRGRYARELLSTVKNRNLSVNSLVLFFTGNCKLAGLDI